MKWVVANAHYLDAVLERLGCRIVKLECDDQADEDHTRFFHQRKGCSVYYIETPPHHTLIASYRNKRCIIETLWTRNRDNPPSKVMIYPSNSQIGVMGFITGNEEPLTYVFKCLLQSVETALGEDTALMMHRHRGYYSVLFQTGTRCHLELIETNDGVACFTVSEGVEYEHRFYIPRDVTVFSFT